MVSRSSGGIGLVLAEIEMIKLEWHEEARLQSQRAEIVAKLDGMLNEDDTQRDLFKQISAAIEQPHVQPPQGSPPYPSRPTVGIRASRAMQGT
jgi:hypothetical protein